MVLLTMLCSEFLERHSEFRDGLLTAARELRRFERHLAHCETCRRYDATVRQAMHVLHSASPIVPSPEFRQRLDARLAVERRRGPARPARAGGGAAPPPPSAGAGGGLGGDARAGGGGAVHFRARRPAEDRTRPAAARRRVSEARRERGPAIRVVSGSTRQHRDRLRAARGRALKRPSHFLGAWVGGNFRPVWPRSPSTRFFAT